MSDKKEQSIHFSAGLKDAARGHKKLFGAAAIILLLLCGIIGYRIISGRIWSMQMSLLYQEASNGLNPNGTRYNPYLILSDEVIGQAEKKLGYKIRDNVWIRPSASTKGGSIAAEYTINCSKLESCPAVLEAVAESYTDYFETHYTMNDSILSYEEPDKELDYIEISDYLEKEISKITSFITKQIKKDGTWYADDGTNYQDLLEYGENILNIDLANYRAYITENGISKNANALSEAYAYRNLLLDIDKQTAEAQYKNRRDAITLYDPTLFPTISVPSVKNGEYYVTTTKTGLDYIYDAASSFSETAYKLQRSISQNELVIRNMNASQNTDEAKKAEADQKISGMEQKIKFLISRTKQLDEEYKKDKRTQYLMFGEVEKK